jgi:hypothetical protein
VVYIPFYLDFFESQPLLFQRKTEIAVTQFNEMMGQKFNFNSAILRMKEINRLFSKIVHLLE